MESKRILITGAQGTVGALLTKFLAADHDITTLRGRSDLDLTDTEATDQWFAALKRPFDVVIHCAASGTDDVDGQDFNIARTNLCMYENLKRNRQHFRRLLNIATGCELRPEPLRSESTLTEYLPTSAYGLSKNLIARDVLNQDNWYNLRLFGLATYTRVFKNVSEAAERGETEFNLTDRDMDYLYEYQLEYIVRLYIETDDNLIKDVNMVTGTKYKVSDYVQGYISRRKLDIKLNIVGMNPVSYTGDATNSMRLKVL